LARNFLLYTERRNAKRNERKAAIIGMLADRGLGEEPNTMTAKRSWFFYFFLFYGRIGRYDFGCHRYSSFPWESVGFHV
jgi:hypothetical protein